MVHGASEVETGSQCCVVFRPTKKVDFERILGYPLAFY